MGSEDEDASARKVCPVLNPRSGCAGLVITMSAVCLADIIHGEHPSVEKFARLIPSSLHHRRLGIRGVLTQVHVESHSISRAAS